MSQITKFAKGQPCTIRLPEVCNHDPATPVWVHINSVRWGSGKGIKSPDIIGAIGCSACHDVLDGRVKTTIERDYIKLCALEGHCESLMLLHKAGII